MAKSDSKQDWLNPAISIEANTDSIQNPSLVYGSDPASHMLKKVLRNSVSVAPDKGKLTLKARVVHVPPANSDENKSWFASVWPWAITEEPEVGNHPVVHVQLVEDNRDAFLKARPPDSNNAASGKLYRKVTNPSGLMVGHGSEVDIILKNPHMGYSSNPNIPSGHIVNVRSLTSQNLNGTGGNCNPRKPKGDGSKTVAGACNGPVAIKKRSSRNWVSLPPPSTTAHIVYPTNPISVTGAHQAVSNTGTPLLTQEEFFRRFVTSGIGARDTGLAGASKDHGGIDMVAPVGAGIYASLPGKVVRVRLQGAPSTKVGYGWYVVIRHDDFVTSYGGPLYTLYAHMKKPIVRMNQSVSQKQKLGVSGDTGRSTGPHLHFEVWYDPNGNSKLGVKGQVIDSLEPISEFLFGPGLAIKNSTGASPGDAYGGEAT